MEFRLKNYRATIVLLLVLTFSPDPAAAEQQRTPGVATGLTATRNGLALHRSGVRNIQSVLGPTMVFKIDPTSDVNRMCYVSSLGYTLIAFEIGRLGIFRILVTADKHRYGRWDRCTATPLSSDDLTLANGVTLGLGPADIEKILGSPHSRERDVWHYVFGMEKPDRQTDGAPQKGRHSPFVSLDLAFTDSRLIHFDILVRPESESTGAQIRP